MNDFGPAMYCSGCKQAIAGFDIFYADGKAWHGACYTPPPAAEYVPAHAVSVEQLLWEIARAAYLDYHTDDGYGHRGHTDVLDAAVLELYEREPERFYE